MNKIPEDYTVKIALKTSIGKEELLIQKYDEYFSQLKSRELKEMFSEFTRYSQDHIKLIKDKLIQLNIQD